MNIKRTKYLFFYHRNFPKINFSTIISGEKIIFEKQIVAIPILYGKEIILTQKELNFILDIPDNEWVSYDEDTNLDKFLKFGIILSDSSNKDNVFKDREALLIRDNWHIYAALFNFMTKWEGINVKLITENIKMDSSEDMKYYVDQFGKPPLHYHQIENPISKIKIENTDVENDVFYDILLNRKTTRNFDKTKQLSFKKLSKIINYSFGTKGYRGLYDSDIKAIKRTSPSGGDLHPTELYMLILRVENMNPGIYHFNTESNELHLVKEYSLEKAEEKAIEFSAGQQYTSECSVMFFMTTRYYRNYWKYRKNSAAYSVTVRDAAHICQNIYLLCTKNDIGCFTAAINHRNIEEEIGLNSYEHGVTMMMGCGVSDENPKIRLEPNFTK